MLPYISLFVFRNAPQKKLALLLKEYQGIAIKARPLQNRLSALQKMWEKVDLQNREKAAHDAKMQQQQLQFALKQQIDAANHTAQQLDSFDQPQHKKARTVPQVTSTAQVTVPQVTSSAHVEEILEEETTEEESEEEAQLEAQYSGELY